MMGTHNQVSVFSIRCFGILSLIFLLQLYILQSSHAATTAETDLLRRQKPVLKLSDVYADSAKFNVDIPNPIGGRFLKCGERGTHVVQFALQSNPSTYIFAHNVDQESDGFEVGSLNPNTEYIVRVACKFNDQGSPGDWSEAVYIRTLPGTGKADGGGGSSTGHHHHHHDHGDHTDGDGDGGGGSSSGSGGSKAENQGPPGSGSPKQQQWERTEDEFIDLPIPSMLKDNADADVITTDAVQKTQFYGVIGEWANLTCTSTLSNPPLSFEWIQIGSNGNENVTVKERFGVHILQEDNVSTLMMIVKTEDMLGQYICESEEGAGTGQKEQQNLILLKGRRPSRIHLIPELILMTTASFKVEPLHDHHDTNQNHVTTAATAAAGSASDTDSDSSSTTNVAPLSETELNEKYGVELPFAGYVVWLKPACHLLGEWIPADVTVQENGFRLNNLHPNEGYYIKAAQRNTGGIGDFGEYWKIRTSSATLLKSTSSNAAGTATAAVRNRHFTVSTILVGMILTLCIIA